MMIYSFNRKLFQNIETSSNKHVSFSLSRIMLASLLLGMVLSVCTRVGTLIVATIYLQLIQNRYMFRIFTVFQCSHQHCAQPVASDVEVVGYI